MYMCLQDPNLVSPALFSGAGASLGISPFQQALMNLTPNNHSHHTPRSSDGMPHFRICRSQVLSHTSEPAMDGGTDRCSC